LLCTDVRALPSREGEEIDRLHLLHRQHKLLNIFSNCSQQQALAKPAIATRTFGTRQLLPCGSQRHSRVKFTYIGIETISFDRTAWLQLSTWITLLSCAEIPIRESVLHYRPFVCDLHLCNTASESHFDEQWRIYAFFKFKSAPSVGKLDTRWCYCTAASWACLRLFERPADQITFEQQNTIAALLHHECSGLSHGDRGRHSQRSPLSRVSYACASSNDSQAHLICPHAR
jgi:hypothetical protein